MSGPARTVIMPPMPETNQAYYTMECRECEIEETCYPTPEPVDAHTKEHNARVHPKAQS